MSVINIAINKNSSNKKREFSTYPAWKKAVKEIDPKASFTGDKDIDSAFKKGQYDAEFDGTKGYIIVTKNTNIAINSNTELLVTFEKGVNIPLDDKVTKFIRGALGNENIINIKREYKNSKIIYYVKSGTKVDVGQLKEDLLKKYKSFQSKGIEFQLA